MKSKDRGFTRMKMALLLFVVLLLAGGAYWYAKKDDSNSLVDLKSAVRAKVERGDLMVTVLQAGELEAKESKSIINDNDRERKITFVVDDGMKIKKGDLLVELDSADLRDDLMRIESEVSKAEADLRKVQEDIEISKVKYASDLKTAELKLELAKLDLKKYQEAEFPQLVREKEVAITLAKEDLATEQNKLNWTQKLFDKGYANRQDLETGKLAVTRKKLDLEKAQEELRILKDYTHAKDLREKTNTVAEAQSALETVKKTYQSGSSQAQATLAASKTQLELKKKEEQKKNAEIAKTRVVSEYEGQVFYPKMDFWRETKIEKGASVYGRQKILEFPDLSAWLIKVKIPESIIEKVRIGQEAVATIDAISNKTLRAKVAKIGAVPDKGSFFESAQKVYPVSLDVLTTSSALKPGMSLMVEIITNRLTDITKVPVQAVTTQGDKHFVYVISGAQVRKAEVHIGSNNENFMQILDGVKEGEEILLYAPVRQESRPDMNERPLDKEKKDTPGEEKKEDATEQLKKTAEAGARP